jgi:SAM-dependent methyltransferase
MGLEDALAHYKRYFNEKIEVHGAVPEGVDYNGPAAQSLRFEQLVKVIDASEPCEIIDFGCGYGGLLSFLQKEDWAFRYHGYDMLEKMIHAAREAHSAASNADFTSAEEDLRPSQYVLAGAIFNNKFEASMEQWREHTLGVLRRMNTLCTRGMAFNMLSSYSDADRIAMRPDLYFADPLFYFDHCKRNFSRDVALLHDYGLFDFTIIVRKTA